MIFGSEFRKREKEKIEGKYIMNHFIVPDWPAPNHIKAFTTTRLNGVSSTPFQSFNLAHHVGDSIDHVLKNRALLKNNLKLPNEPIWLNQAHSNHVINLDQNNSDEIADGSYTTHKNKVCVILTGDCLPILLCDKTGKEIAAVHGGWRGLLAGVIESALMYFKSSPENIYAWLGPAIGPQVYEVGDDVRDPFIAVDKNATHAFKPYKQSKWLANIYLLAQQRLEKYGVTAIYGGNHCTYSEADKFFSHRRDKETGRMANLIWIE